MQKIQLDQNMTKTILTVRWNQSAEEAWRIMQDRKIRHLPVTGESGVLEGIVSERDLRRAVDQATSGYRPGTPVAEFMQWPVLTVDAATPVEEVVETMIRQKISSLLVTRQGHAVGITTSEDMLLLLKELLRQRSKDIKFTFLDLRYVPYLQELIRETSSVGI